MNPAPRDLADSDCKPERRSRFVVGRSGDIYATSDDRLTQDRNLHNATVILLNY